MRASHGQHELQLGEKTYTLKPTIACYEIIDDKFGGALGAIDALRSGGLNAATTIACAGIGTTSKGGKEHVKQAIFEAGVTNVAATLVQFLSTLAANPTGKEDDEEEGDSGKG